MAVVAGGDSRNAGLATDERPERFGPQNGAVMHKVRRRRRALIAVAALVAHPATGGALAQLQAQTAPARLALVIGNSAYTLAPSLPSCAASANVAAARLRAAGFEVAEHLDASNGATGAALNDFAQAIAAHPRAAAIVYVCGYGVNFRDRDFVLPVSATLTRPSDVLTQGVVARAFGTAAGGRRLARHWSFWTSLRCPAAVPRLRLGRPHRRARPDRSRLRWCWSRQVRPQLHRRRLRSPSCSAKAR